MKGKRSHQMKNITLLANNSYYLDDNTQPVTRQERKQDRRTHHPDDNVAEAGFFRRVTQ
jgi:hypothetical protein